MNKVWIQMNQPGLVINSACERIPQIWIVNKPNMSQQCDVDSKMISASVAYFQMIEKNSSTLFHIG